jgi:hypothetical protein
MLLSLIEVLNREFVDRVAITAPEESAHEFQGFLSLFNTTKRKSEIVPQLIRPMFQLLWRKISKVSSQTN